MYNDDNIPSRLLNGFNAPSQRTISTEAMEDALLSTLIDMPENAFVWNELKQVYVCRVAGRDIELRKSSYEGLKYMRELKKRR
jgi:hypothetical protein